MGQINSKEGTLSMSIYPQGRPAIENPAGKGRVFNGKRLITEVSYKLQVFQHVSKQIVTGKIKTIDGSNILWGTDLLTLHLQDKRKLDFICVNFDPECDVSSYPRN
jgi:hypothetical protein